MSFDIFAIFNIFVLVEAIWLILPAYTANGLVPFFKGKRPIDGNRKFIDGKPILGPGKTWEGLIYGSIIGAVIAFIQLLALPYLPFEFSSVALSIVPMSLLLGFLLGFGALFGDIVASFFKRRIGIKRGHAAPILDQDDFIIGALLFASLLIAIKIEWVILLLVITPLLHLLANMIGYLIKVKKQPY
ncbi:MAG: CDP-2,3-bis-(O-geranylgeranyl)-sn-glycerol synthase [Nanoarchaeota archaeon]|nr:CDP-2,3-bis-(O-geranylgeranyl)-sn-glycerol synthase [Nanoarchaeota archaeon]MBU1135632.1 CDP-2,3-bis-(O-geranylgeranyl)-sn-glycerol synthase [Nanoarchaeota archaeon]MBU2519997.1 CDP-2,3-bis-(O-geranylgeranyl)-sn-glycerol synthase [Nanoarchaeota archaeon]